MLQKTKYKSKSAATETVRRLFSSSPNDDFVSIDDAFRAAGRDVEKVEDNKAWLSNKLPTLKYHNLIIVHYSYDTGRRKLDKLQLTLEGKRALGRIDELPDEKNGGIATNSEASSITDIMKIVAQLQKKHPEFEITFDVKLKVV